MCLKFIKLHIFAPAVFRASFKGDLNRLEWLIANGENVNDRERDGLTPLMVAAQKGKSAVTKMLIDNGADVNAQDNYGMTPLVHALQNTWLRTKIRHMANSIKALTASSQADALHYLFSNIKRNNAVAQMLILHGANLNLVDSKKMTPLMYAAIFGNNEITELLLSKGADVNAKNNDGVTPLMMAILAGKLNIVTKMIEYGADVNAVNNDGASVIFIASFKNNKEILEILRAKGAKGDVTSCAFKK